ncbi:MAG: PD40 domain-containing protein [Chloroflexi bacterium]|nr:PD40 domain-containing protein [Chloroflexota bacterium]
MSHWSKVPLLSLLILLLSAALISACGPGASGPQGVLAFTSGKSIYIIRFPTAQPQKVEEGAAPALSPDGRKVAFAKEHNIWVANLDGSGARLLAEVYRRDPILDMVPSAASHNSLGASSVAWAPDDKRILYARSRIAGSGISEVWVMNADGSGASLLLRDSAFLLPTWLPDSKGVSIYQNLGTIQVFDTEANREEVGVTVPREIRPPLLAQKAPKGELWLLGRFMPSTREVGTLYGEIKAGPADALKTVAQGAYPIWSPDGSRIAYYRDNALWIVSRDGSDQRRVVDLNLLEGPPPTALPFGRAALSWVAP